MNCFSNMLFSSVLSDGDSMLYPDWTKQFISTNPVLFSALRLPSVSY